MATRTQDVSDRDCAIASRAIDVTDDPDDEVSACAPTNLPGHAERFLRRSGVITWHREDLSSCELYQQVSRILHAFAVLEEDTAISARQARSLGLDRSSDIAAFLPVWEQEEAEHGRALRFVLAQQQYNFPEPRPKAISLRRRFVALLPATVFRRLPQTELVYCALGAAAEYVTIAAYTEVAKLVEPPAVVALLRSINRQEGRHMAFFLSAARARADATSKFNGALARRVLTSLWEPPGVASLGLSVWRTMFAPLLDNDEFLARAEEMDRVVDTIPHLEGLKLMGTFIRQNVLNLHRSVATSPS